MAKRTKHGPLHTAIAAVVREKDDARGATLRRLHRAESILRTAAGQQTARRAKPKRKKRKGGKA